MKKLIVSMVVFFLCLKGIAQQIIPVQKPSTTMISFTKKIERHEFRLFYDSTGKLVDSGMVKKADSVIKETEKDEKKSFGVYGVGNLNNEQLEKFNASGKFSCFARPLIKENSDLTFYLSFNKNATNSDSLLASTLIFPEVGNNSFIGTVEYSFLINSNKKDLIKNNKEDPKREHFLVPFLEFSNKSIKASQDTGNAKSTSFHFSTLNYTAGCKYLFHYRKSVEKKENDVYFSIATYLSYLNIPDQDTVDYRILLRSKTISGNLWSAGVKVAVQYNNFSIFADFRHVIGSETRIPVRELRGFSSNIGVVFNAEIFSL